MMRKNSAKLLYYVFTFCTLLLCVAAKNKNQYKEKELLVWSNDTKLKWEDFKGNIPESSKSGAVTVSMIYCKYDKSNPDKLVLNVRACFIKKESWKKEKQPSIYHLNHEQKHFDVTELFARKLRKLLSDTVFTSRKEATKAIPKLIKSNNKEWDNYGNLYDKETNHSINEEQQAVWDKKIQQDLIALENYTINLIEIRTN